MPYPVPPPPVPPSWLLENVAQPAVVVSVFTDAPTHKIARPPIAQAQQSDPNQDRFLQPSAIPQPANSSEPIVQPTPTPETTPTPQLGTPEATPSTTTVFIQKIEVKGSTVFGAAELDAITKPFEGRSLTAAEFNNVADAITQRYLDQGYITSRAIPVRPIPSDGKAQIQIIEGSLERIDVEGTKRLNPAYVRSRIQLGGGPPLNTGKLEDQLRLLRTDPLFENVEASLRAGTQLGKSILIVRVTEASPFNGNLSIDSYSPPSVGSERFGINLGYRNVTGNGDAVAAAYTRTTTGGAEAYNLVYQVPLNAMNGTLQLRAEGNRNRITLPPFDVLNIRGESELYEISYRQPIVRSPREELALSFGFTAQGGQTFVADQLFGFGPDPSGITRTRVIKFGQDYVRRDPQGAWALRSQFSFGTGWFDATQNPDPIPDGQFFSWLGQIQRVQRLGDDHLFIAQADLQLTPDGLLPSQQFVMGGGQSVRGYRQNARFGDNGFRISLEDRITVHRDPSGATILQLAPFVDVGAVWNVGGNPTRLPSQTFLAGAGLGILWAPLPQLNVRLDYGVPLVDLSDRGNNAQDRGFYFSVNYQL